MFPTQVLLPGQVPPREKSPLIESNGGCSVKRLVCPEAELELMLTHSPVPPMGWTRADSMRACGHASGAKYHAGTKSAVQVKIKCLHFGGQIKEIWTSRYVECWLFHPLVSQDTMQSPPPPEPVWMQVVCLPAWR